MRSISRLWHPSDNKRLGIKTVLRLLPQGSAWIFREYDMRNRNACAGRFALTARSKRLTTLIAASPKLAWRLRARRLAAGTHSPAWFLNHAPALHRRFLLKSAACHTIRQGLRAARYGANLLLISPIYSTASHPKQRPLGLLRARIIMREIRKKHQVRFIALGGMDASRFRAVQHSGLDGIAAIQWLSRVNKTKLNALERNTYRRGASQR
ncbi:hypothetical protein GC177_06335 [bacterium]|nr:hypothetical protein [bacterium]